VRSAVAVDLALAVADQRRRLARRRRYALRAGLWQLSNLKSVKGCARNVNQTVGTASLIVQGGIASFEGLDLCSSIWACPCCSARIRQARALDVERAGVAHLNAEKALEFLTLTMPHDSTDALKDTLDAILNGFRDVQQRKGWKQLKTRLGIVGFIRATEITYTSLSDQGAGWHPHLHVLLFLEQALTDDQRADLEGKLHAWWSHAITRRGFRSPAGGGVGVNLRAVEGRTGSSAAGALAAYLTKVQDGYGDSWNVGSEMLRGDLKTGRRALSVTPLELAAQALGLVEDEDGNRVPARPERAQLWHEYETATKGRRAIYWSKGLRARYLTGPELEDEQLPEVTPDDDQVVSVVAQLDAQTWRQLCRRPANIRRLLDYAEHGQVLLVHQLVAEAQRTPLPGAPPP
jgi:hypothetical protein